MMNRPKIRLIGSSLNCCCQVMRIVGTWMIVIASHRRNVIPNVMILASPGENHNYNPYNFHYNKKGKRNLHHNHCRLKTIFNGDRMSMPQNNGKKISRVFSSFFNNNMNAIHSYRKLDYGKVRMNIMPAKNDITTTNTTIKNSIWVWENGHGSSFRTTVSSILVTLKERIQTFVVSKYNSMNMTAEKMGTLSITIFQIGFLIYMIRIIWKSMNDIMDEIGVQQQQDSSTSTTPSILGPMLIYDPKEVQKLMDYYDTYSSETKKNQQQDKEISQTRTANTQKKEQATTTPLQRQLPLPILLHIGNKLLASGLPIRSIAGSRQSQQPSDDDADTNDNDREHYLPSIESILLKLTTREANILQQCLWTPPITTSSLISSSLSSSFYDDDDDNSSNVNNKVDHLIIWNNISGLHSVKERLLGTVTMMMQNLQNQYEKHHKKSTMPTSDDPTSNHMGAYSSLFQNKEPGRNDDTIRNDSNNNNEHSTSTHGILLYGPPGCGKTLLVKSLSKATRLPCLVVSPSVLLRKYVGETNIQVCALFSLANKIAPCIVCIDELDGLFRERNDNEHEVSRDLKTEFLQWLDGMKMTSTTTGVLPTENSNSNKYCRPILVIGATNRPFDVDSAILRRLSQSHYVGLPDSYDRLHILQQLIKPLPTESNIDVRQIAVQTSGYSPSDLRQVLQTAALIGPLRRTRQLQEQENKMQRQEKILQRQEMMQDRCNEPTTKATTLGIDNLLTTTDILNALDLVPPTPLSQQYRAQLANFIRPLASQTSTNDDHNTRQPQRQREHGDQERMGFDGSGDYYNRNNDDNQGRRQQLRRWETEFGNFYHIGSIEVDHQTFDTLTEIATQIQENDNSDNSTNDKKDDDDDDIDKNND